MVLVFVDAHISIQVFPMVVLVQSVKLINAQLFHGLLWNYALWVSWINVWILIQGIDAKLWITMTPTLIHLMHTKMNCKKREATQLLDCQMILLLLYVRYHRIFWRNFSIFFQKFYHFFSSELDFKSGTSDIFRSVVVKWNMVPIQNVFERWPTQFTVFWLTHIMSMDQTVTNHSTGLQIDGQKTDGSLLMRPRKIGHQNRLPKSGDPWGTSMIP